MLLYDEMCVLYIVCIQLETKVLALPDKVKHFNVFILCSDAEHWIFNTVYLKVETFHGLNKKTYL